MQPPGDQCLPDGVYSSTVALILDYLHYEASRQPVCTVSLQPLGGQFAASRRLVLT